MGGRLGLRGGLDRGGLEAAAQRCLEGDDARAWRHGQDGSPHDLDRASLCVDRQHVEEERRLNGREVDRGLGADGQRRQPRPQLWKVGDEVGEDDLLAALEGPTLLIAGGRVEEARVEPIGQLEDLIAHADRRGEQLDARRPARRDRPEADGAGRIARIDEHGVGRSGGVLVGEQRLLPEERDLPAARGGEHLVDDRPVGADDHAGEGRLELGGLPRVNEAADQHSPASAERSRLIGSLERAARAGLVAPGHGLRGQQRREPSVLQRERRLEDDRRVQRATVP